jgi:hypothetical protein
MSNLTYVRITYGAVSSDTIVCVNKANRKILVGSSNLPAIYKPSAMDQTVKGYEHASGIILPLPSIPIIIDNKVVSLSVQKHTMTSKRYVEQKLSKKLADLSARVLSYGIDNLFKTPKAFTFDASSMLSLAVKDSSGRKYNSGSADKVLYAHDIIDAQATIMQVLYPLPEESLSAAIDYCRLVLADPSPGKTFIYLPDRFIDVYESE